MSPARYHHCIFETAGGFCGIAWSADGIVRFQLPTGEAAETERLLLRRVPGSARAQAPGAVAEVVEAVKRHFAGETVDFSSVVLDLDSQDDFRRDIYAAARRIGWGRTTTYGALAKALGLGPEAARDVGQAMAKNPVALIIPCHRVLAAGGKLGGFSAPGGSQSKVRMLELEGVKLAPAEPVQTSLNF
ncbi:methylated-DNA--[protein]-cysteine S-methyltransferase [Rhizobium sp. 18065]|uniref:methylated-DNA--[protein]-cysteine S-methyltransferase n=1 Tax=Rhizobium sp. 18065 TaxID=2681411 RepID=UPI00135728A2|nr:methylated-DNA--[protein]-cysteine S-methyltransferase [Rhizobium sp. 18065]